MSVISNPDFVRLQGAVKSTMIDVACLNYETPDQVDFAIDTAFFAIGNCFPQFDCISDTVTRRCAKTEIYTLFDEAKLLNMRGGDFFRFVEENITCESVFDDLVAMHDDDE